MTSTNVADFRQNPMAFLEQAMRGQVVSIAMEKGSAIVLNGEEYRNIMETLRLSAHPRTAREVLEGMGENWDEGERYDPEKAW